MKILHISDIHLGKKIAGYSMLEDQEYFLKNTIKYMKDNSIEHLILAGDIYDISSPSGEAINIFSEFLNELKENNIKAFIISGNHDSNERVGYGNKLISKSNIYINTSIKDAINPICCDGINYYLIPYTTVSEINTAFGESFKDYDDAMSFVISKMKLDKNKINIALSHQLVLSGKNKYILGGSEDPVVGTVQNISESVYKDFSYVALGHIHKPQKISDTIYYSGSPLAYHINETKYEKTYNIVNIKDETLTVSTDIIKAKRESIELEDTFENLVSKPEYKKYQDYYIYVTLKDENYIENAMDKIKNIFPYALSLRYAQTKTNDNLELIQIEDIDEVNLNDLFESLFKMQKNKELSPLQKKIVEEILVEGEDE